MLYEMAKRHDDWPGHKYPGSTCRGAIRGWNNMGVCTASDWPYQVDDVLGGLTIERAVAACRITLGAYYRLRPYVVDYHAAINETGAVYCSAQVHEGWRNPEVSSIEEQPIAVIRPHHSSEGGHAFAIIGYCEHGFWVQNSWGSNWGVQGIALWLYEDWIQTISDGWVFQLALPTPQIFRLQHRIHHASPRDITVARNHNKRSVTYAPKRKYIAGHFVHFDDGHLKHCGDYWSDLSDIHRTTDKLLKSTKYDSLLIYAAGGLNSPKDSARRIRAWKERFTTNRIYPFHIMYDTGLFETIEDLVRQGLHAVEKRAGGVSSWTDKLIEWIVRKPGTAIWEEIKRDAYLPFEKGGDGCNTLNELLRLVTTRTNMAIHFAGHSTAAILFGHLLVALETLKCRITIETLTLFAPACRVDFFKNNYVPFLSDTLCTHVRIKQLLIYSLTDEDERDDKVAGVYRKSLLYLISNAFERSDEVPLLGMKHFHHPSLLKTPRTQFLYSNRNRSDSPCRTSTHQGFDNDLATMNGTLQRIAIGSVSEFTAKDMEGYY